MKTHDLGSSLFWLLLSIYVCIESIRGEIGTIQNPGADFISFGASVLLGTLSLALFLKTLLKKEVTKTEPLFTRKLWKRVIFVLVGLTIYANTMSIGGYLISTFFLMSFLFWIVKGNQWRWVLINSLIVTFITYYIFSVFLKVGLPKGLLGI